MPPVKAPAIVLVTGASGFIAAWVCNTLLEAGYTVRGTVRSVSKGDYLVDLFKSDKFSYVVVEDMAEDNAFDEAVKGVDAVAHIASPFHWDADQPEEMIKPALNGTIGILRSIQKNAPGIRRVVATSSIAAIVDLAKPDGTIYTEVDWNASSLKEVEQKGRSATGYDKYSASKILAEKAAWAEVESQKPSWDLATIHPPNVFGPFLHQVDDPTKLNTSIAVFYKLIHAKDGDIPKDHLLRPNVNYIDVRDVALAHVRALEVPEAGGQRFITANGPYCWQDALDLLPPPHPRGMPGAGKGLTHNVNDASKAHKLLGISFKGFEETIKATESAFRERGWGLVA